MPALVNNRVGSFAGISELEATRVWPFSSKKRRKASRISALFIDFFQRTAAERLQNDTARRDHRKPVRNYPTDSRQRAALYRACAPGIGDKAD